MDGRWTAVLYSIPKLDDGKRRQEKSIWLLLFLGHDPSTDLMKFEIVLGWAPDLMHPQLDRGKAIPALFAAQWTWFGPETRRMIETGPNTIYRWRSDWKEIWKRMLLRRKRNADV